MPNGPFRQMDQGVFRRGLSEQAIDADPSPESGTVSPLTRPPAWKSLAGNSHFQRLNEEGIRAEQAMVRQSQQDSPRASTARQPRWKSGIGTLQREFPDGSIEDHDPEALLDDPEVGPLAAQSLYLRDVKAAQDDEAATHLRLDDPADQRKLADKKREEILSIGAGLAESDPEHQKLKKQLIDHDARVKEEQELYQKRVRLQQIKQGGVSGWFQQRQQAKPIEQKAQEASQQAQANTARIIAAEKSAALEEEQLSQQAQQGVRGNDLPAFQQRQQELAAAKAQIAEQKAQAMEPVKAVQAEAQAKEKDFFNTGDTISGIWDAVKGLGTSAPAAFYQLTEGMNRPDQYSDSAKKAFAEADAFNKEMQAKTDANQKAGISSSVGESFREAGGSLGFSLGSMAAAIPAGMAGSAAGEAIGGTIGGVIGGIAGAPAAGVGAVPAAAGGATLGATIGGFIGGTAASMAASGTAAYRMAGASFLNESFQQIEAESMRKNGRPMNEEEKQSAYDALLPIAKNTALWEAGPEAVGNAVTLGAGKIIFGLGTSLAEKFGVGALAKAASKGTLTAAQQAEVAALKGSQKLAYEATRAGSTVSGKVAIGAADLGVELGTETVTQVEQSADQKKAQAIAQWQDPSAIKADWSTGGVVEAFKEVAPQTLALMGLMGGAGGALKLASKATGIGAAKPGNPPATEIDIKPDVDNALIAIDPQNALAEREEINKAALISRPTDGPSEIADAVLIERELSVIEQEDADFTASSEQAVLDATTSGDKATIKAAEAARDSFRPNRAATTRAVLKVASGQSLVNLTTSELDALGLQAKEGKPDKAGNVRIEFTEKPVPKGQSNRPKMIRMGEDGSSVLTDEALKVVSEASPRARARVKLTETEALQKAKARAASTPWTVTGAAGTSVKVQAKTREEAERMAVGMPQWKLGETVKTAIEGANSQSTPNSSQARSNEPVVVNETPVDAQQTSLPNTDAPQAPAPVDDSSHRRSLKMSPEERRKDEKAIQRKLMEASLETDDKDEQFRRAGYQQVDGFWVHPHVDPAWVAGLKPETKARLKEGGIKFFDPEQDSGGRMVSFNDGTRGMGVKTNAEIGHEAYSKDITVLHELGHHVWQNDLTDQQRKDFSNGGIRTEHGREVASGKGRGETYTSSIAGGVNSVAEEDFAQHFAENGGDLSKTLSKPVADPATLKRKITKAIAERKKGTSIPINISTGIHANATEAGIQINPSRLADIAAKAGFSEDQTGEWIASVIDEEIRHVAHLRAARAVFEKAGSPGGDFEAWRDSHYGEMWKGEFTDVQKTNIATLYGENFAGLKDWQKAMEGLRMISQQLATGSPTEVARLWKKLSQSVRDHILAALESLKAMASSLSPALKAEMDALDAAISQYVTQPPATPDRSQKPAPVKTPVRDGAAGNPSGKADSDGGPVVGGRADLPSVGDRVRTAAGIEGVVVGIADDKKKVLIKTDSGNKLVPVGEVVKITDTKPAQAPASPATEGNGLDIEADTAISEIRDAGVAYFKDARFAILQGDDEQFYVLKTVDGKQQPVTSWWPDIEAAQQDAIRQISAYETQEEIRPKSPSGGASTDTRTLSFDEALEELAPGTDLADDPLPYYDSIEHDIWNGKDPESQKKTPIFKNNQLQGIPDPRWMSPEDAAAKLAEWKAQAKADGANKDNQNSGKYVVSLFDSSGVWSQPWQDAGYTVIRFDLDEDSDSWKEDVQNLTQQFMEDNGLDMVDIVLAQPPCTDFSLAGNRWFTDPAKAEEKKASLARNTRLVDHTLDLIGYLRPLIWGLENPIGTIKKHTKVAEPRLVFDPFMYGADYTKRTQIFGTFNENLPEAMVYPAQGSRIHKLSGSTKAGKTARSLTPEQFAYAFYMANRDYGQWSAKRAIAEENAPTPAEQQGLFSQGDPESTSAEEISEAEVRTARVQSAIAEIEADIQSGTIPDTVRSFSELADYVDANEYVNDADREDRLIGPLGKRLGWKAQDFTEFTNIIIRDVDSWLASRSPAPAPKPKQAKKPRKISRNLPRNVEMFREDPLVAKLMEIGKIMSKSRALKVMGREWFKQNASLYNDAPTLSPAFVSSIYSDTATLTPDQMATYLADAGQGDGTVNGFWQAIGDAANSAAQVNKQAGIEEKRQTEAERQLVNFSKGNVEGTNTVPVNAGDLEVGNTVVVDGEEMTVKAVEDDGSVVLEDGSKFGRQTINGNETVWAEMDDSPFLSEEDLDEPAGWLIDNSEAQGYETLDEHAATDPAGFEGLASDAQALGQGSQEAGDNLQGSEDAGRATGSTGQVKRPASKMDIRNADSKELFADDGGFKLGQDSTVDGDKVAADRKAKEEAKAAQDAAQGDMFGAPALTEAEQALKDAFGDMVDGLNAADISQGDSDYLAAVERGDMAAAQAMVFDSLVSLDNEFFSRSSWAARMNRMAEEREKAGKELDYAKSNRADAKASAKKAEVLRIARGKALKALPQAYVQLKKGTRFIAGILDLQEGGGIDFQEVSSPYQELAGAIYKAGDTQWLLVESGKIERGTPLMSGGMNVASTSDAKGIIEQFQRRELSPSAYNGTGLESIVSAENPLSLVGIVLLPGDVVKSADPITRDAEGNVIPLSQRFNPASDSILYAADISDTPTYTQGIPPEKIGQFISAAQKLIAEGVKTPNGLASALEKISPKLRAYSDAVWSAFRMVDPSLQASPNWAGVYESLTPKVENQTDFQAAKAQVIRAIANDVRDSLLRGENLTVDQIRTKTPLSSTLSRKELDETIEAGITAAAHRIAKGQDSELVKFQRLVTLYQNQPSLNAKTSTSKINQAYSTPAPMGYVASLLADIRGGKVLDEPTGGHAMLMMEARPDQTVEFNEIDAARRERTKLAIDGSENWRMTGEDATSWTPSEAPDRIASNPPFGSVMAEDGSNIAWFTAAGKTTAIDHAIMLKQLASMTPDGRAVFIIGGPAKTARSEASRKEHYGKGSKAAFFKYLHDNYGVVDHFTVDGDMYAKQGAGWNVDVITIQGKKPSRTALPSAKAPRMISSWADLFETTQLTDEQRIQLNRLSEEEVRDSVRGMVDALAGIGNVGGPQATGARNESGGGQDGTGGNVDRTTSSESPSPERFSNEERSAVDGSRDAGAESESAGVDAGSKPAGENTGTRGSSERSSDTAGAVRSPVKESGKFQAEYTPFSGEKGLDTLLPKNMVGPVAAAFDRIKKDLGGNLTKFVHEKLGYPAGTDITKYLAGEQIDAVAAAIWNFERGGALIIGDQTGIGKGRIAAALMKYAVNQGYIPVFMTKDPGLHDAMLTEDLPDIASPEIIPAVMDTKLQFDSAKKRKLNYGEEYFAQAASTGALPGDANAIFVTYSQITADDAPGLTKADRASARNAGEAPADKWRMRALRLLAPNAVFILDESHLASGQSTTGWRVADILRRSSRVYYSSATSVKRPENMGIYFKTNVGMLTGGNMAELTELMNTGGVPAMQVVSSMLAQDGQYLRRERSFDGVKFITQISEETADRDRELADGLTGSLRHIVTVQDAMRQAAEAINGVIAATGKRMGVPAANRAKLETVNFSSKLHNIVGQYLLAIKTQSAADTAIREIRAGKKVVVAVQSTMESAIDGLEFGGFEMSYKGLVLRYLDQMRFLTSGNKAFGRGEVETFEIKEKGLPEFENLSSQDLERRIVSTSTDPGTGDTVIIINEKVAAELMRRSMWDVFARSRDAIEAIDLGNLPISPIDAMRQAVEQAGIRTGEITGRKRGIDTSGEIYVRPAADTAKPARRVAQAAFNNEDLDFLVINQSGSTGISLHASEKAKNQATRVMVVAQPNLDINEFMQTLGRIHRSGQVVSPEFILLQTALPAEKRPAAILGKKMSMLNANTTSNAKTDVSEGNTAIDIFNQYGDEMAYKVLERDKDLQDQLRPLGSSLAKFFNKETGALVPYQDAQQEVNEQPDGYIARTITGYLAILPVEEQEIFWEKTLADYQAFISYLDQIGQNALEAKALDLQAKTTASEVFTEKAEGDSAFSAPSYIETVETKVGRAPLTGEKAVELSVSAKAESKAILQSYLASADAAANDLADKKSKRAIKAWDGEKRSEFLANQRAQRNVIASAISLVGRFGSVKRNDGNAGIGVIEEIRMDEANPLTPSKQIAVIRVNDSRETLRVPVTQLNEAFTPDPRESAKEWDDTTDVGGESAIATGNLMAAMKALGGAGKVITYTTDSGVDKMGILLPKSFLTKRAAIKSRTQIDTAEKLLTILDAGLPVTNSDGSIKWTKGNSIATLSVPASRARGGDIWRNPMMNRMSIGGEFTQVGNDMRATYSLNDVPAVFKFLTDAGETFSSQKTDEGQGLQAADISGESNGQERSDGSGSQQNEADRIPSRAEIARPGEGQGSGRGAKEIAIQVFGGKSAGGSQYLSEGAESLVERVGKDWVIKTIADKGVFVYTPEGKLSRSNEFEDVQTKARIINVLGGFETHAVKIEGKGYLIQRHGEGYVSEDDLDGVRLPFNLQPNQVNRVQMDGDTYLVSDLHAGNFRKDDSGKIRVIDLIASKVPPQVSLLDEVDDSLLAADISDNETLPNIADLREKGRATMAGPEVEAEIRAQQAAFKQQGKVAGRPDLANISADEDVRAEMDVTDEMRKWVAQRQEKQQWENEGRRLVEADADAVEEKILEAAYTRGGQKFTAADVVAGRILAEKRTKEAGNDKQKHADAAVLRHGYREVRSEQARVLAAGTDPFKTPEERHRDFIAGALYDLPQSLLNDIEGRSQSPAQARAAIRKAVIERLGKIEKALKKMGVTLDEITSGQVSLSLAKEKVMKDAIAKLSQAEKLAVAAIQKGGALPDIRKLTGLSDSKIQELNNRIRRELRDKIRAKVQAGMKLEDLKGKLDGLRAASMLSDEEVDAEVERILAVGFGMPTEVPSVRKSVKRAKVKIVAPIDANWNRPEFTDGLDSYTFNTADRAEIMRKVATLRDLAGVEGKVAGLTGDKKAKGVRLIAEINSILSKYDTSVETILREGKDIADYRFDMSDRNHVMVVARTINAIDADLLDKGSEYYYASILSGLQTMMVNATTIVPSVWDMTIGRGFEMATNLLFRDPMAASFGEIKYILKAAGPFLTRAWTNAAAAWGTEMPFFEEDVLGKTPDLDAIFESRGIYRTGSIGGNLGRLIRTPTRLLLATDEFVRTANACMEVGAMAYRLARREGLTPGTPKFDTFLKQQVNLPGSPAWQLAAKKAADRIFAAPLPTQTDITTGKAVPIRDIGDVVGAGAAQMGKFLNQKTDSLAAKSTLLALRLLFFPFQKVPFNIVRQAARRTLNPISLVDIGVLIGRNLRVQDGKWTLNAKGGKAEIAERLAQQAQGALLVMLLAATGAGEGDDKDLDKPILITGSRPYGETKKGDRELGYRLGLGPYEFSVKMPGGKRVGFSYGRLEPAATVLGATVDTMRELAMYRQGKQSLGEAGGKIIGALRSQLTEKTFLRGFSDAQQIASGDSDLSRFTAERLAVIMPNIIRQPLREADPNFRERKDGFVDNLSAALWPYGQGEIKRDLYGDPLEKKGNSASRIIDFTDFGGDQAQPLDEMLWRYRQAHPQDSYAPQSPAPNYTDPVTKKPATMTPAQLAKYKEISGQKILALTKRESFNLKNPTESDIKRFKAVVDDGREFARLMLFKSPAWRNLK